MSLSAASRGALAIVVAAIASSCSSDPAPAKPPPWRVEGGAVLDAAGRTVVLRGVNLASAHKAPPYLSDFGPADYARLRDEYGFDSLRFLLSWAALEPTRGAYDERYLDAVAERLAWARDAGLLVVLDMHQDLFGVGFAGGDGAPRWACDDARYAAFQPTTPWFLGYLDANVAACVDGLYADGDVRARFVEAWRKVAARLSAADNVIGFDVLNEPHWGSFAILGFEAERLAPLYLDVTRAVREAAPSWLLFAEPSASRNVGYASELPRLDVSGVVYAPHAYDRDAESGAGFDPAKRDAYLQNVAALRAEADALGAALFIGEYGGDADAPGIEAYMSAAFDAAGAAAAGSAYWAFDKDDGYGLLRPDGSEKKALADVLARPYPARVSGRLLSYAFDAASRTATIRLVADPSIDAPTEIVAPPRVWPTGHVVRCGGCTVEEAPPVVRLSFATAGEIDVTIAPR